MTDSYWTLCDRCGANFEVPVGKYGRYTHYICPECGYHGKDEVTDETNEEGINMENYYTAQNTASRLNCSIATVRRAIHDGTFTDVIQDLSCQGTPAYMIPSVQVEWWKDHGGILKRKSRRTGQEAGALKLVKKDELPNAIERIKELNEKLNEKLDSTGNLTMNEVRGYLGLNPVPETGGWDPMPEHGGKILIEIDASTIQKSVSDQFRRQIANLREAVVMINDELAKLEAML